MIETEHQGQRVRAVRNRIYFRPLKETFHEFLLFVLREHLGEGWYRTEFEKPLDEQHQIVRWFRALGEWTARTATEANRKRQSWSAVPSGEAQALIALAYDVYTLEHSGALRKELLKRLRDRRAFQGARYEAAVAAIFARMEYGIEWIKDDSKRHCEFIAKHKSGSPQVAVEAKSRHRRGVLHEPGVMVPLIALRGDVDGLFSDALSQSPGDIPFIVFVDLNAPPQEGVPAPNKPWWDDLRRMLEAYGTPSRESPDRFTALVVTNFAYHYGEPDKETPRGEFLFVVPLYPKHALPAEFLDHLALAVKEYGRVPLGSDEEIEAAERSASTSE